MIVFSKIKQYFLAALIFLVAILGLLLNRKSRKIAELETDLLLKKRLTLIEHYKKQDEKLKKKQDNIKKRREELENDYEKKYGYRPGGGPSTPPFVPPSCW